MSKNRYKRKISVKKIIGIVFVGALIVGILSSFAVFANDSQPAGAIFKVGGLDETTGKYVENDQTIYTEKAIDCYGLRIEPDFESTVTYDIFYYDANDVLLEKRLGLTDVYDEEFIVAEKCRIVIHPDIPDDVDEDDFKVRLWNVPKYSSMLKITVAKTPEEILDYDNNLFNASELDVGHGIGSTSTKIDDISELVSGQITPVLELDTKFDGYYVFINKVYPPDDYAHVVVADESGNIILHHGININGIGQNEQGVGTYYCDGWYYAKIELPEDAALMRVSMSNTVENCYIYGYND